MGHALRRLVTREHARDGTVEMDGVCFGGTPRKDAGRPRPGRGRTGQPRTTTSPALAVAQGSAAIQRPAATQGPAAIDEGAAAGEAHARRGPGHPLGPFEPMGAATSCLCLKVEESLHAADGERFRPRPLLQGRARAGFVGGRGRPGGRGKG